MTTEAPPTTWKRGKATLVERDGMQHLVYREYLVDAATGKPVLAPATGKKIVKQRWKRASENSKIAERLLKDFNEDSDNIRLGYPAQHASWSDFRKRYLEYSRTNKRPRSQSKDEYILRTFTDIIKPISIKDFSAMNLENYKAYLKNGNKSDETINRHLNTLKNCGTKISEWYNCDHPVKSVRRIKKTRKLNIRIYSQDELKQLFRVLKPYSPMETAAMIALHAGFREEEISFLTWEDVDFAAHRVNVTSKPKYNWQPKDYEERSNRMTPELEEYLREVHRRAKDKHGWVLTSRTGQRIPADEISQLFCCKLIKKAGLKGKGLRFHTLRKNNATKLAESGASAKFLMRWLGHSSLEPVMVYLGITDNAEDTVVGRISFTVR